MSQISDFAEVEILDAIFNQSAYSPTNVYISLHTADPGETGASEVTGGSYARQDGTTSFAAAAAGAVSTDTDISYTDMPATTVTHAGAWDAVSAGNFLWGATLTASKATNSGDTFTISAGNLTFTLD